MGNVTSSTVDVVKQPFDIFESNEIETPFKNIPIKNIIPIIPKNIPVQPTQDNMPNPLDQDNITDGFSEQLDGNFSRLENTFSSKMTGLENTISSNMTGLENRIEKQTQSIQNNIFEGFRESSLKALEMEEALMEQMTEQTDRILQQGNQQFSSLSSQNSWLKMGQDNILSTLSAQNTQAFLQNAQATQSILTNQAQTANQIFTNQALMAQATQAGLFKLGEDIGNEMTEKYDMFDDKINMYSNMFDQKLNKIDQTTNKAFDTVDNSLNSMNNALGNLNTFIQVANMQSQMMMSQLNEEIDDVQEFVKNTSNNVNTGLDNIANNMTTIVIAGAVIGAVVLLNQKK